MRYVSLLLVYFTIAGTALAAPLQQRSVTPPPFGSIAHIERYATAAEYETARSDSRFRLSQVSYTSDDLTVFAYLYAPVTIKGKLPVVVFNRGSYVWREFAGEYLAMFHRLAQAGFIVVAPMYRGSGGAAGRDEMGGADVDDLMNTTSLLSEIQGIDVRNVFMYGESRGGMMTYQAIRDHYPMNAAAVCGAFADMAELTGAAGKFGNAAKAIWPDYSQNREAIDERRSAVRWPERLNTPVLIMHGGSDGDVPPSQSIALAAKLQALGKPYELLIRAGANHVMSEWRVGRDEYAIEWFRRHMHSATNE
jgi:dipeptidyl aminopeptidase/acylaminoacyl peptidase